MLATALRVFGDARYNSLELPNSETENALSLSVASPQKLRGILLPLPTPFNESGDINDQALRANIEKWNTAGIAGHVVLGSTGERVNLDQREYLQVVEVARAAVPANFTFIVGAGQQSTRATINEIKHVAAAASVDAFLVITPHFYRSSITQQALIRHYESVADEAPTPLILYSMPALTGVKIEPETAARLSEHENIIGIKDSSPDLDGLRETIRLVRKDFAVLTGNGTVLNQALSAGACGGILAVGCVVPGICLAIAHAVQSGDTDTAEALQTKLTPLAEAVTIRYGIAGLKAALDMKGYVGGAVRAPLSAPGSDALEEIRICLAAAEHETARARRAPVDPK